MSAHRRPLRRCPSSRADYLLRSFATDRSLLPRGSKLSITSQVPGMDQDSISRKEYIARSESNRLLASCRQRFGLTGPPSLAVDVAVAGRIAEELLNGADHLSDRTAEDLDRASKIADAMVRVRLSPSPLRRRGDRLLEG